LIDNALDFLIAAAKEVEQDDNWSLVVMTAFAGIELLLKARLYDEHWSLIFDRIYNATLESVQSGDFRSVGVDSALKRLKNIAGVSVDDHFDGRVTRLRDLRNKATHFKLGTNKKDTRSVTAAALEVAIKFIESAFSPGHLNRRQKASLQNIVMTLSDFGAFVSKRLDRLDEEAGGLEFIDDYICTECFVQAVHRNGGDPECAYCGSPASFELIAEQISGSGEVAAHFEIFDEHDAGWVCINCEHVGREPITQCPRCSQLFLGESGLCINCIAELYVDPRSGDVE
jgi:hypothetical protein